MGLPITGNVQLFYYRSDLYTINGLKPPKTWDELRANTAALKGKTEYPFLIYGQRDGVVFRAMPFFLSAGGGIWKDPRNGDYSVTFNSQQSLAGMKAFLEFARSSHPNPGSVTLADISQLLSTGKAAQAIEVAAMWGAVNNPENSVAAGKLGVATLPSMAGGKLATASGHWVGGIPKNVDAAQQKAVLHFMKWLLTKEHQVALFENGSIPVRTDLVGSARDPKGVLPTLSDAVKQATLITPIKEGAQVYRMLGVHINQALTGEKTAEQALNAGAKEVHELMKSSGYKTGLGADL
jgi:multiple sugar transport system substrate-binding protein